MFELQASYRSLTDKVYKIPLFDLINGMMIKTKFQEKTCERHSGRRWGAGSAKGSRDDAQTKHEQA